MAPPGALDSITMHGHIIDGTHPPSTPIFTHPVHAPSTPYHHPTSTPQHPPPHPLHGPSTPPPRPLHTLSPPPPPHPVHTTSTPPLHTPSTPPSTAPRHCRSLLFLLSIARQDGGLTGLQLRPWSNKSPIMLRQRNSNTSVGLLGIGSIFTTNHRFGRTNR